MTDQQLKRKKRRISIEIDEATFNSLNRIPWGLKSRILRTILRQLASAIEGERSNILLGGIVSGAIKMTFEAREKKDDDR